jgi:hypothetical protein
MQKSLLTEHRSFTQLKFLENDMSKCLRTALQFEHETISRTPDQNTYNQSMMRKLAEISTKRNQNLGGQFSNGGQMQPNQQPGNHTMNPAQMNQRVQQQQNMGMPPQQMPNNGMNQLSAPGMQQSLSQNAHQQQPHINTTPNPQQAASMQQQQQQQQHMQEVQEAAQRIMAGLTDEKKVHLRNNVIRNMTEQQRQQASATKRDPLVSFVFTKAKQEVLGRRQSGQAAGGQQSQNMQMTNAGGVNMSQSASQQGGNFDFTAIMGQQANALKLQESGNEVVPASNNPNNNPFNGQMSAPNGSQGGINPAMLGNGSGPGGPQMQPNMAQQQQLQMVAAQRDKQRQEQLRNNANNAARAQALQQAQLHGQNMGPQNALNGAAGGSPAMTMLNRPMQPPGSQAPNTPQQPNRTPNMQQPNPQQQGQTPANGTNALMQHHQSMVNRNNAGVNWPALFASLPPHPILQIEQAQQIIRGMPPPIIEKLRATPGEMLPAFIKQWAATEQQRRGQNQGMQMGGQQGGINGMPNGMPDVNMQQSMLPQGQGQAPPGLDPAVLQARMQQQQQQQQQQRQLLLQDQQLQNQQLHQQQPHLQQPTPLQHLPPNVMDQLPQAVKQQAMLSRPFPPQIPQQLGIAVPPGMQLWGHLKAHIDRNSNAMPPNTSLRFSQTISKWFHEHPQEFQNGVKQVIIQRQRQAAQQQPQVQNQGQLGNNNAMGMPNGNHGAAPTAQMMQPNSSVQQGAGVPPMGPGQGQLRPPPLTPVGALDVTQFRQRIPNAHAMTDEQIRGVLEQSRQKGIADQNNALKQAQMQNMLPQNAAGGNQQPRMNRTPGQVATEQMAGPQPGQKRAQPTSSANDDVMEIPNPNALQPPPANKARPTGPLAGMKLPNLTPEQLEKLAPEQREQVMKRYESLRQANAGARPTQAVPTAPQVPGGSRLTEQKNVAKPDPDNLVKRLYQEVNTKKGPPVQQDAKAVQEIIPILRKIFIAYQQIDKVFSNALRLPEFSEERIKKLMEAKIMVFHNWDPALDCAKGALSINLQQAKYAQNLIAEFLRDLQQAKARGQWNQNQAQQAANQIQQQQPATAATKQPAVQAPTMEKSGSKHGRKSSSSSKVPAAPIDNRTFDWSQGVSSPHGIPKYESGSTQLTPDKLQLPPNKRRRTGQPESAEGTPVGQAATPSGASPGVGGAKSSSPEQLRKAQMQAKLEADARDKKRWKCTKDAVCEASITGFETEEELKGHFDTMHKEIEDPLQFLLDSAAETLGVDLDGKPLPGKAADPPKAGSRLLPPKATAMKRESSNTPGVKHEARTPAGQMATPATPGSANKAAVKATVKQGAASVDPSKPTNLHDTVSAKMGYHPVAATDDATTASALANDQLWAEISSTVASGLATFEPLTFDGLAGAYVNDWGLRPDDGTGLPSSPETTPESSNTSLNSDVSSNDRLRINFEWDAFGNGDTAVPEMLNAAVDGLGIGGPEIKFFEDEKMTGVDQPAKTADDKKKSDGSIGDPFEWTANADVSWESIYGDQGNAEDQFDFTSGNQDGMQMQFEF